MAVMGSAIRSYNKGMGRMNPEARMTGKHQEAGIGIPKNNNAYRQYRNDSVYTASPQELTLMLYNGLVKFLKLAFQGIEERNIEKANNNILKAQDILAEFMSTLDMQYEVSEGLYALYDYMNGRLVEANVKKDKDIVEEVIGYSEELRDTWAQAMKLAKQQAVNK